MLQRGEHLPVDRLIARTRPGRLPPLGMPQDHVVTQAAEHGRRHVSRVSSRVLPVHGLRAQSDPRIPQNVGQGRKDGEWRTDRHIHRMDGGERGSQTTHQGQGLFGLAEVHLPVGCDQESAHGTRVRHTPGRGKSSNTSRLTTSGPSTGCCPYRCQPAPRPGREARAPQAPRRRSRTGTPSRHSARHRPGGRPAAFARFRTRHP